MKNECEEGWETRTEPEALRGAGGGLPQTQTAFSRPHPVADQTLQACVWFQRQADRNHTLPADPALLKCDKSRAGTCPNKHSTPRKQEDRPVHRAGEDSDQENLHLSV